ncbi:MAG: DUF5690 family protein, partial [Planctomycetota bacterium]|nr:DUF5690 family protein [Planctomycetota bacterium]
MNPAGELPVNSARHALSEDRNQQLFWAVWSATAAFGAYFCMYAVRKPFTAATFAGTPLWGLDYKIALVTSQVFGYMV